MFTLRIERYWVVNPLSTEDQNVGSVDRIESRISLPSYQRSDLRPWRGFISQTSPHFGRGQGRVFYAQSAFCFAPTGVRRGRMVGQAFPNTNLPLSAHLFAAPSYCPILSIFLSGLVNKALLEIRLQGWYLTRLMYISTWPRCVTKHINVA